MKVVVAYALGLEGDFGKGAVEGLDRRQVEARQHREQAVEVVELPQILSCRANRQLWLSLASVAHAVSYVCGGSAPWRCR